MNIKKSVRSSKNTERDTKVKKAREELNKRINDEYPGIYRRLFKWIFSLNWIIILGAIIVIGPVIWSFVGHLNIPINAKLLLVSIPGSIVGILASKNTMRREKKFKSP